MANPSPPPLPLDPPFRGYIETTFDALLVFEAARRGMIPRVTRRLIERERGMVQSGAVFVFDEHESGIKRWTDGLVWSPSRILGNFLVCRIFFPFKVDSTQLEVRCTARRISVQPNPLLPCPYPVTPQTRHQMAPLHLHLSIVPEATCPDLLPTPSPRTWVSWRVRPASLLANHPLSSGVESFIGRAARARAVVRSIDTGNDSSSEA